LITGANRGIGLEFVKQFKSLGYKVIGTSRGEWEGKAPLDGHVKLDVDSLPSIASLPGQLSGLGVKSLDLLILNAGVGIFGMLQASPPRWTTSLLAGPSDGMP